MQNNITVPEPTASELEDYYKKNANKFAEPIKVSFTHIYFTADGSSNEMAKSRAINVLQSIKNKSDLKRAPELGDQFMLLYDYEEVDKTQTEGLFGASPFTDALFSSEKNKWIGPFASGYGWHLVYINKKDEVKTPLLNQIRAKVIESYKRDKLAEMNEEELMKLIDKYNIELNLN